MSYGIQIVLPEDVLQHLMSVDRQEWVPFLANFFADKVLKIYEESLARRVKGSLGGPLSRAEKTILTDMLIDATLGMLRAKIEAAQSSSPLHAAREAVS